MNGRRRSAPMGLWTLPGLPDLWTRKRTRAHKVLGRRQTNAGAHSPLETGQTAAGFHSAHKAPHPGKVSHASMEHRTRLLERFTAMT